MKINMTARTLRTCRKGLVMTRDTSEFWMCTIETESLARSGTVYAGDPGSLRFVVASVHIPLHSSRNEAEPDRRET